MTPFEIIILSVIYIFCLGFVLAVHIKEENMWLRVFLTIGSFVLAIYAPLMISGMLYDKLKEGK